MKIPPMSLEDRLELAAQACHAAHLLSCEATCREAATALSGKIDGNDWYRLERRLAILLFTIAIILALMCEHVNAAPQELPAVTSASRAIKASESDYSAQSRRDVPRGRRFATDSLSRDSAQYPAVAAPFKLSHPLCATGFMLSQRIDTRDRFGIIVKRQWVPGCARVPKIIYGGKV